VYVGPGVIIGAQCKIQNNAQLFEPAVIEDGVFVGPGAILTNDRYPRAITPDAKLKSADDWNPVRVHVEFGASIGAGAICVAPIRIGKWSMIAAGSVVTTDVQPFQLVAGIPARAVGWVGPAGLQLSKISENEYQCPQTSQRFQLRNGIGMEPLE
jgi:acetyltransferase-like isoleucine patch superfamily enzyme